MFKWRLGTARAAMINDRELREVNEETKLRLLKAIVQMMATYHCESWPLRKRELKK